MKTITLACALLCALASPLLSGKASAQNTIPKLVINKKTTYTVDSTNILRVDTLIMQDKSVLQFASSKYGLLEANVTIIGKDCVISAKGEDGEPGDNGRSGKYESFGNPNATTSIMKDGENGKEGEHGKDASNLTVRLHFIALGSLTLDMRGGDGGEGGSGGNGARGSEDTSEMRSGTDINGKSYNYTVIEPGRPGGDGGHAAPGGSSGDGGNLVFMYSTDGFIPVFNQQGRSINSITILTQSGKSGKAGKPGGGGIAARSGNPAFNVNYSSKNGQIMLINMDAEAKAK